MEKYLGENIPQLGFGLMRLPMNGEKHQPVSNMVNVKKFVHN